MLNEKAQRNNARLSAIPVLLSEYSLRIDVLTTKNKNRAIAHEERFNSEYNHTQNYPNVVAERQAFRMREEKHPDQLELIELKNKRKNLYEELDSLVHGTQST